MQGWSIISKHSVVVCKHGGRWREQTNTRRTKGSNKDFSCLSKNLNFVKKNINRWNTSNHDSDTHIQYTGNIGKMRKTPFCMFAKVRQRETECISVIQLQLFHFKQMSLSSTKYTCLCDWVSSCLYVSAERSVHFLDDHFCVCVCARMFEYTSPPCVSCKHTKSWDRHYHTQT